MSAVPQLRHTEAHTILRTMLMRALGLRRLQGYHHTRGLALWSCMSLNSICSPRGSSSSSANRHLSCPSGSPRPLESLHPHCTHSPSQRPWQEPPRESKQLFFSLTRRIRVWRGCKLKEESSGEEHSGKFQQHSDAVAERG